MVALGETISGWKLGRGRGSRLYSGGSRNRRAVCASTVPMVNNLYQGMALDPAGTAVGTYRLSYRTTQRPIADHNGRFGPWRIQWDIHPAPAVPPQGAGAYVVQKIHVTIHVADARTHQVLQQDAVDKTYWEAWTAVPSNVVPDPKNGVRGWNDELINRRDYGNHTDGTITVDASASFYFGVKLVGFTKLPASGHVGYAGNLPTTTVNPDFASGSNLVDRELTVTWRWCRANGLDQIKTVPTITGVING